MASETQNCKDMHKDKVKTGLDTGRGQYLPWSVIISPCTIVTSQNV